MATKKHSKKKGKATTAKAHTIPDVEAAGIALQCAGGVLSILCERNWEATDDNAALGAVVVLIEQADEALFGPRGSRHAK